MHPVNITKSLGHLRCGQSNLVLILVFIIYRSLGCQSLGLFKVEKLFSYEGN